MSNQKLGVLGDEGDEVGSTALAIPASDYGALAAVSRAEVDMQVTTARQYPRSVTRFQREAYELATLDEETAESMFYSLPRKDPKTGKPKPIEGPSVRFAEVIAYAWGNLRFEGKVIDIGKEFVTAQGMAWDLERNLGARIEVKRRITGKSGTRFNDDMIAVTGNAAVSIALRNAIFDVVPFALAKKVYEAAVKTAMGEHKPMALRRSEIMAWFRQAGATDEDVFGMLGVTGENDLTTDHIRTLIGARSAVKEGTRSLDEIIREAKGDAPSAGASAMNEAARANPAEPRTSRSRGAKPAAAAAPAPEDPNAPPTDGEVAKLQDLMGKAGDAGLDFDGEGLELAIHEKNGKAIRDGIRELSKALLGAEG